MASSQSALLHIFYLASEWWCAARSIYHLMYYLLPDRGGWVTFHLRQEFVPFAWLFPARCRLFKLSRLRVAKIYWRFQFCISCELFPVRECFRNNGRRIWVALFKSRCRKCISNCRLEDGCQECKVISNEWENTRTWTEWVIYACVLAHEIVKMPLVAFKCCWNVKTKNKQPVSFTIAFYACTLVHPAIFKILPARQQRQASCITSRL